MMAKTVTSMLVGIATPQRLFVNRWLTAAWSYAALPRRRSSRR
jgi:hypothetical protein